MKRFLNFKNLVSYLSTAAFVLIFSGCIKQKILVDVKPDGSGTIKLNMVYKKEIVDMLDQQMQAQREQLSKSGMDDASIDKMLQNPLFNEEAFKQQAKMFGQNIEYVKSTKLTTEYGRGISVLYSFKNIEDVRIDLEKLTSPGPKVGDQEPSENAVSFKLKKGDTAVLTVTIPTKKIPPEETALPEGPTPLSPQEKAQLAAQGAMFGLSGKEETKEEVIRKMYGDMSIDISLQVEGVLIQSNATYQDPAVSGRCTLFSLDFGAMLEDDVVCTKMARNTSPDFMEAVMATGRVKGLKYENKPELTIEFKEK